MIATNIDLMSAIAELRLVPFSRDAMSHALTPGPSPGGKGEKCRRRSPYRSIAMRLRSFSTTPSLSQRAGGCQSSARVKFSLR